MFANRLLFFGAVLAYLALPGHPLTLLPGLPLGLLGILVLLAAAGWAVALPGLPRGWRLGVLVLGALAVAKLGTAWLAPAYGLLAEYRAGGSGAPVERSTAWPGLGATRIDRSIVFHGDDFPVHFFNDVRRFNFYRATEARRDLLPFSVRWTGQLWAETAGRYRLTLEANGRAELALTPAGSEQAARSAAIDSGQRVQAADLLVDLPAGGHPIEIRYARPPEAMPWLDVSVSINGGAPAPLAAPQIALPAVDRAALARDGWLHPLAAAIDVVVLGILAGLLGVHAVARRREAGWERPLLALLVLGLIGADLVAHLHLWQRAVILSGGNDWLAYESFARQVALDGPLLTDGRPLGQGQPFYYQPLYSYWLALVHGVLGEGVFGPLFMNATLGVVAALLVYLLSRELFGRLAALAALGVFCILRATVFAPTTGLLLSENLLFPLIPLLLLLLARASKTGALPTLASAGLVLGLAGLTRTTPLALLPPALGILALAFRRLGLSWSGSLGRLSLFVAVCVLTVGLATARNYVVAGRPVLITSSAGANLWEAHRPTERVDLSRIDRDPLYDRLGLDRQTREVVEFVRQDPAGYAATLAPMALYAIGVVGAVAGSQEIQPILFGSTVVYAVLSLVLPASRRLPTWFLHAFVLTHLAQMTVFFSHQYGFRLILPMYVAMAPIIGFGVATLGAAVARPAGAAIQRHLLDRRAARRTRRPMAPDASAPHLVGMLSVATLGALTMIAAGDRADRARESFYGLAGDAAVAARQALRFEHLRLADMVYFVGDDSRSTDVAYLSGLAFPAMRWFDGARGVVLPPSGERALYVLPVRAGADVARRCLGDAALRPPEQDPLTGAWLEVAVATDPVPACAAPRQSVVATFDGGVQMVGYDAPASLEPGQGADVAVHWVALERPANRARPLVRLLDSKDRLWGQAEVTMYASSSWRPGERVVGLARLEVDPTLPPGDYRVELGLTAGSGLARLSSTTATGEAGQTRVAGGVIRLVSRSSPIPPERLPIDRPIHAALGEVRLLGVSLDRESPRPGERVRLTLYWQNTASRLASKEVIVVLRGADGAEIQGWRGIPVDGTYPTTAWKTSEIVRDTWDLVMPATLPTGQLTVSVDLAAPNQPPTAPVDVATLTPQPVQRQFRQPTVRTAQEVRLGDVLRLVGFELKNRRLKPGDSVELTLVWQALAEPRESYVVRVQMLGIDDQPIAQHAAEPANGRRPTTGWVTGEYVEDSHRVRVPRDAARGRYRLALVVELADEHGRLADQAGADRIVLNSDVVVE